MRQQTRTVYYYDELNDKAKERARRWFTGNDYPFPGWYDYIVETFTEFCEAVGLTVFTDGNGTPRLTFDVDRCEAGLSGVFLYRPDAVECGKQYMGWDTTPPSSFRDKHFLAALEGDFSRLAKLREQYHVEPEDLEYSIRLTPRGFWEISSDNYPTLYDMEQKDAEGFPAELDADVHDLFEREVREIISDLLQWLLAMLADELTYLWMDETIEKSILANEYEFLEDGTPA